MAVNKKSREGSFWGGKVVLHREVTLLVVLKFC